MTNAIARMSVGSSVINRMISQPVFHAMLPMLKKPPYRKHRGCRCKGKKGELDYNKIKMSIAGLSKGQKLQLKTLLKVKQLVVTYRDPGGNLKRLIF